MFVPPRLSWNCLPASCSLDASAPHLARAITTMLCAQARSPIGRNYLASSTDLRAQRRFWASVRRRHASCDVRRVAVNLNKGAFPMNQDILSGKWKQMRGQVKQWWGKLTDDDLDRIDGTMDRLAGALQERYGWEREEAERQIQKHFEEPGAEQRGSSRR
jgi:uncharacterized protein YjbJ (UPF0337 family)